MKKKKKKNLSGKKYFRNHNISEFGKARREFPLVRKAIGLVIGKLQQSYRLEFYAVGMELSPSEYHVHRLFRYCDRPSKKKRVQP